MCFLRLFWRIYFLYCIRKWCGQKSQELEEISYISAIQSFPVVGCSFTVPWPKQLDLPIHIISSSTFEIGKSNKISLSEKSWSCCSEIVLVLCLRLLFDFWIAIVFSPTANQRLLKNHQKFHSNIFKFYLECILSETGCKHFSWKNFFERVFRFCFYVHFVHNMHFLRRFTVMRRQLSIFIVKKIF